MRSRAFLQLDSLNLSPVSAAIEAAAVEAGAARQAGNLYQAAHFRLSYLAAWSPTWPAKDRHVQHF